MENKKDMSILNDRFNAIWEDSKRNLELGNVTTIFLERDRLINPECILALVAVANNQSLCILPKIKDIVREFKKIDPNHYYYPDSSFHITVAGCTPFFPNPLDITKERENRIRDICSEVLQTYKTPIKLTIRGVNAISGSIFLQVFSLDGAYSELRQKILSALKKNGENPIDQLDTGQIHMNILKFTHKNVYDLQKFSGIIQGMRNIEIGDFFIDNVELDFTDKLQSPFNTRCVKKYSLVSED